MLELYHHGISVCAVHIRIALEEKNLSWTGRYVDILKGEQHPSDYLKLNPKAVVPTLIHDGNVIHESMPVRRNARARRGGLATSARER